MYTYQELGLVNTKEMFAKAYREGYAVPALNFVTIEQLNGMIDAVIEKKSPVILLVSPNLHRQLGHEMTARLAQVATDRIKEAGLHIPVALHLDHGADFEICKACIDGGFTSVMIDGSHHSFEDNIALTKKVVEYAHDKGVVVEGELGQLAGIEDDVKVSAEDAKYTHPDEVEEFVSRTGVDSLAIAIGTSHGAFKFKPGQKPMLRFDILDEVAKRLPEFPIVLHGASSVSQEYVKIIQAHGGNLADAIGIPEDMLRQAARSAVCKINIDSDLRLAMTAGIREVMWEHPEKFDPREYLKVGRQYVKDVVAHKITEVLGCAGKAAEISK